MSPDGSAGVTEDPVSRTLSRLPWVLACLSLALGASSVAVGSPAAGQETAGAPAPRAVSVRAVPARSPVRPGDRLPVAVVLEHRPGFHTWPHDPVVPPALSDVVPVATDVRIAERPSGVEIGSPQWPEPAPVTVRYTGRPVELLSYVETSVIYLPLQLAPNAPPGRATIRISVRYQACDPEVCYFPETRELEVPLRIVARGAEADVEPSEPRLFAGYRMGEEPGPAAGGEERSASAATSLDLAVFDHAVTLDPTSAAGMALLLLLAAVGGLLLNFTPCVLPLVPIKVMSLRSAAGSRRRLLALGATTVAGILGFWLALGGAIATLQGFGAISSLFQTGWFAPLMGLVVALAGLSMLGLFHVPTPRWLTALDPDHETVPGAFVVGLLVAALSTPCTAPFMAGASAWATLQAPVTTLVTFGAIGAGMATPYLALSAWPALVRRVPRSGPASVVVEQVMGLLLLAVAAFFLGTGWAGLVSEPGDASVTAHWWAVAALVAVAFTWLAVRTWQLTGRAWRRWAAVGLALLVSVPAFGVARELTAGPPVEWVPYTSHRLEAARNAGEVVVIDFTAEWCLNCKALEAGVLHREPVASALSEDGVVPMRIDLTGRNPAGRAKLEQLEWVGLPLLAVYGPGLGETEPLKYDSYTPAMVMRAIERAR